ncbi:MAG: hypothetical protein V3U60_09540 [Gammaproteobacteria bacterium]
MLFKFADNVKVVKLDVVPESFRAFYAPKTDDDGAEGFVLKDSEEVKAAVASITGLNTSLGAARAEASGLKGKATDLSALADYGTDPESILAGIKTKIEEIQDASKNTSAQDVTRQLEKIKADLAKTHATVLQQKDTRIDALRGQLYGHLVDSQAVTALRDSIDPDLALPFVKDQVKVEEVDGKYKVNVVDKAGDVRYSGVTGSPMTINELVDEMKTNTKFKPLFKSTAPAGGGVPPAAGDKNPVPPRGGTLTATDKISAGLKAGNATRPV